MDEHTIVQNLVTHCLHTITDFVRDVPVAGFENDRQVLEAFVKYQVEKLQRA